MLPVTNKTLLFQIQGHVAPLGASPVQVMPDDHSKSVPPLPIPNRTVKRYYADDSAATSVKVGYRQASYKRKTPQKCGVFFVPKFVMGTRTAVTGAPSYKKAPARMPGLHFHDLPADYCARYVTFNV